MLADIITFIYSCNVQLTNWLECDHITMKKCCQSDVLCSQVHTPLSIGVRYLTLPCILHNLAKSWHSKTNSQAYIQKSIQMYARCSRSGDKQGFIWSLPWWQKGWKKADKGAIFWIFVLLYFCTLYFALLHFVFLYFTRSAPVAEVVIKKRRKLPHSRMHITPWAPYRVSYKVDWYKTSGNLGGITYT